MPPAARIGDMHVCPMVIPGTPPIPHVGGPIIVGSPNVIIGGMPAARVGDMSMCVPVAIPDTIAKGSAGVMINGMPAARIGDLTSHGGTIVVGFPTVLIGEIGSAGGAGAGAGMAMAATAQAVLEALAALASGEAMTAPEKQAAAMRAAAQSGTPFQEVCR